MTKQDETDDESPEWYDEKKLRKVQFADDETGWVIDLGDGTCRYVNEPLVDGVSWGDRVPLIKGTRGWLRADSTKIIEKFHKGEMK